MNIIEILNGEVNIDHKGVKRWRYLENGQPKYLTKEELEDIFNGYIENMEFIIEDMK